MGRTFGGLSGTKNVQLTSLNATVQGRFDKTSALNGVIQGEVIKSASLDAYTSLFTQYLLSSSLNAYTSPATTLPNGLISYWKLDGNSTDELAVGNGTDTAITYSAGNAKLGQGAGFNGSTSKVVLPNIAAYKPTNFTIAAWIRTTGSGYQEIFESYNQAGSPAGFEYRLTGGNIELVVGNGGSYTILTTSSLNLNNGVWNHVLCTYDGATVRHYVNGVASTSGTHAAGVAYAVDNRVRIGVNNYSGGTEVYWFNGAIDEVGFWNRALSAADVAELYNYGVGQQYPFGNPATLATQLAGYWKLDGNSLDSLGVSNGTDTAATYSAAKLGSGFVGNGTTSVINLPNISSMSGATPRTVSAWVKKGAANTWKTIYFSGSAASNSVFSVITSGNSAGDAYVQFYNCDCYTPGGVIGSDRYYHVVWVYDGGTVSSSSVHIYVDGVAQSVTKVGSQSGPATTTNSNFMLGADPLTAGRNYDGSFDEVGVWSRALDVSEVASLYNKFAGQSYPFSTPATLTTLLQAYYNLDGNSNDSLGSFNGTDTAATYSAAKISSGFVGNGTTSQIALPNITALSGSTPRTISMWVKKGASNTIKTLFFTGTLAANDNAVGMHINVVSPGDLYFGFYNNDYYTAGGLIGSDRFYHVVAVYDGGPASTSTVHLYVDGTARAITKTGVSTGPANTVNTNFRIGVDPITAGRNYDGSIDEVGLWSRALDAAEVMRVYNASAGQQYPFTSPAPLTTGLVSYYKLDGNSTDSLAVNNGADTAITYSGANGIINNGAGFNGSTSFIDLGSAASLNLVTMSFSAWVKNANTSGYHMIVTRGPSAGCVYEFRYDITSGTLQFIAGTGSFACGAPALNVWHHLCFTRDSQGNTKVYVDAVLAGSGTIVPPSLPSTATFFGKRADGYFMDGAIDEAAFWSHVLSPAEVLALYNAGAGIQYPF